jgi:hypothetical protein
METRTNRARGCQSPEVQSVEAGSRSLGCRKHRVGTVGEDFLDNLEALEFGMTEIELLCRAGA